MMAKELFIILVSAGLASGWWAVAMFAQGQDRMLFVPVALASVAGTAAFITSHYDD